MENLTVKNLSILFWVCCSIIAIILFVFNLTFKTTIYLSILPWLTALYRLNEKSNIRIREVKDQMINSEQNFLKLWQE